METTPGSNLSNSNSRKPKCQLKHLTLGPTVMLNTYLAVKVALEGFLPFNLCISAWERRSEVLHKLVPPPQPHRHKWHTKAVNITSRVTVILNLQGRHVTSS